MRKTTTGFTLVELLIVIVIIAILAAITVVAYNGIQTRAKQAADVSAIHNYTQAFQLLKIDTGSLPTGMSGSNAACLGPDPQPSPCNLAGQKSSADSTASLKTLLAEYGLTSQPAAGTALSGGHLVYTSSFFGEPALLWHAQPGQDCVASPGRFNQSGTNTWMDNVVSSSKSSSQTLCYMSLASL